MDWQQIGGKIAKTGASLLGTAVAGPGAGSALGSIVGNALGVDDPTPDNIGAAIDKDPEAAVKLAEIQATHRTRLEQIAAERAVQLEQEQTKRLQAEVDDRKSARAMGTDKGLWPQIGITAGFVIGYFSMLFLLMSSGADVPGAMQQVLATLVGVMTAGMQPGPGQGSAPPQSLDQAQM